MQFVEWASLIIEFIAVAIILVAIAHGGIVGGLQWLRRVGDPYEYCRNKIGKALLLSLELLVAADIIRTIVLEPNLKNVAVLGLLVLIRTFLSWSVSVEIEGHWPWYRMR